MLYFTQLAHAFKENSNWNLKSIKWHTTPKWNSPPFSYLRRVVYVSLVSCFGARFSLALAADHLTHLKSLSISFLDPPCRGHSQSITNHGEPQVSTRGKSFISWILRSVFPQCFLSTTIRLKYIFKWCCLYDQRRLEVCIKISHLL